MAALNQSVLQNKNFATILFVMTNKTASRVHARPQHVFCRTHSAIARDDQVSGLVLVSMRVSANDDALGPARHQARDGLAEDGLTEHSASKDVTNGTIRTQPHLLQLEL